MQTPPPVVPTRSARGNVLVIEDSELTRRILAHMLREAGYVVHTAPSAAAAEEVVSAWPPDAIILDLYLGDDNGDGLIPELCRRLPWTPILVVSASNELWDRVRAFELGAKDYLVKPVAAEELLARLASHLETRRQILEALARQVRLNYEMERDPLTGLLNRRGFDERLRTAWQAEAEGPVSLLLFDIDHFKRINDAHGHQTGDDALRAVAAILRAESLDRGFAARYGGEELAIIAPNLSARGASLLAERIRRRVAASPIETRAGTLLSLRVSCGLAERVHDRCATPEELVRTADRRLYLAKNTGRNRVVGPRTSPPVPLAHVDWSRTWLH